MFLQHKYIYTCNSVLIETHFINIDYAMYGRLVSDDGSAENCAYGSSHGNRIDSTSPNRLVLTFAGLKKTKIVFLSSSADVSTLSNIPRKPCSEFHYVHC